jgi:beta-galactosidase
MKPLAGRILCAALLCGTVALAGARQTTRPDAPQAPASRETLNFNLDWRFIKDDPPGAAAEKFDDSSWTQVSIPHTYNDVDTFDNASTPGHRGEQIQWGGRTWYRKSFVAPSSWRDRKVFIEFEGVRQIAEVHVNGVRLGVHKTGFTPFGFDLTPHLRVAQTNVLAVMADNRFMTDPLEGALPDIQTEFNKSIPENMAELRADQIPWNNPHWHPAHGGIYRNVKLHITDPLYIPLPLYSFLQDAGPYAYAHDITDASAQVTVEVPVKNERGQAADVELRTEVIDAGGNVALTLTQSARVPAGASADLKTSGRLASPRMWEPEYPHVYRVVNTLRAAGRVVDSAEIPLGIRTAMWDVDKGFSINGRPLKLRGWGQKSTNEWPGLGAALPNWLHFYTLRQMREAGANFVRWGHTAAAPAQIAAADRLGLIVDQPGVDGEADTGGAAWLLRAQAFRDTVIYFRNHPSILVWEGGNQKVTREHARELRGYMDTYDPHGGRVYTHRRPDQVTAEVMDVGIGTEGGREIAHLPVFEGEYNREESPRRVWDDHSPPNFGYPEAKGMTYQLTSEQFAVNQVTQYKKIAPPWHAGGANWIYSDSTSGGRVPAEVARASGEVDGVRLPKEAYYVAKVIFDPAPQVHIIGHWTYPAGTKKDVFVASNAEAVEVFVNSKSQGQGARSDDFLFAFRNVAWEPGEIRAVATRGGRTVATQSKRTAGGAVRLNLKAITNEGGMRADGQDIVLIDVEAVDANGNRHPTVQERVDFEVEGPGVWRGGYNSGKLNSVNNTFLDLEAGVNRVAIRATRAPGRIIVRATSARLQPATITIESRGVAADGGVSTAMPTMPNVSVAATRPSHPGLSAETSRPGAKRSTSRPPMVGRFIKTMEYSGPGRSIVHVETNAANGRNVYVDRDYRFTDLPASLVGADWIQVADGDGRYSAVDLVEMALPAGTTVTIAHDPRAPAPGWLTLQFRPAVGAISVNGQRLQLYTRVVDAEQSLTLGSNTAGEPREANMYLVFVTQQ